MYKKIILSVSVLAAFFILTACSLPSFNLSSSNLPDEVLTKFMDAVLNGEDGDIDELLYNYSWDNTCNDVDEGVSPTDTLILNYLAESRAYQIIGEPKYTGSHSAQITLKYTTFDIKKFQQSLQERVVEIIKQKQYNGATFESPDDTKDIIEKYKKQLLENPDEFYTTEQFTIEMINSSGKWRVVLSDKFYSALTGYAV